MTLLERYCAWSIEELNDETGLYTEEKLMVALDNIVTSKMGEKEIIKSFIQVSLELTSQVEPRWQEIAAKLYVKNLYEEVRVNRGLEEGANPYDNFYGFIKELNDKGLYGKYILDNYSKEDIEELEKEIKRERDFLFTYSGINLLAKRYLVQDFNRLPLELPQQMFMGIAMHLAIPEKKEKRLYWAKRFYDVLSSIKATMATPTMSNARKPFYQLSSCFIDTVDDSLAGIYKSLDNFSKVSKFGGGMGIYMGKVRALGSAIRGFKGASGGIIPWIKLFNDTAIAVDQLGVRNGSVAIWLDAWHKDLPEFLQIRTNNGDDRKKAHDIFPGLCYPDLFWKLAENDIDANWYMMCPHEIKTVKGYSLEDFYGEEWEKKYYECVEDDRIEKRVMSVKDIVRLIIKSAAETGTPFAFYRDTVNKFNPNKHKGMIYSSNLCTEIMQNMSPIELISQEIQSEEGPVIVTKTRPGDFVVCNLASLVLGNINLHDEKEVEYVIETAVRGLDNVIDLNYYPLPYAKITNQKYRAIGLGTSGYHHALIKEGFAYSDEEDHYKFADEIYEKINYYAIKSSMKIAKEKGSYEYFKDSDWENGRYFEKRNYTDERWTKLKEDVKSYGLRNGYIMAVAPTGSTSIIAGTTAAVDPLMKRFFLEEKKGSIIPRVAPELNTQTFWLYENAHEIDQSITIKATGIRQRHVDQGQSVNLYITNEFTMRQILNLYILASESGLKSIYYVRGKSLEVEECEVCAS